MTLYTNSWPHATFIQPLKFKAVGSSSVLQLAVPACLSQGSLAWRDGQNLLELLPN